MRVFLTSDTHFNHAALCEYESRPIDFSVLIVDHWNKLVLSDDLVIHLGDVCFGGQSIWSNYVDQLNGRKILVRGNHDKKSYTWYLGNGFDFVCEQFMWEIYGLRLLFTHEPIEIIDEPVGFDLNIHGHCHSKMREEGYQNTQYHKLFALEDTNYNPVLLSTFVQTKGRLSK